MGDLTAANQGLDAIEINNNNLEALVEDETLIN